MFAKELSDELDDLFGGTPKAAAERQAPADFVPAMERIFTEPCSKCGGSGRWRYSGQCFKCKGKGKFTFKTAPETRAANRVKAQERRADKAEQDRAECRQLAQVWIAEHAVEHEWLVAASRRNTEQGRDWLFPQDMLNSLNQWGSLTENQFNAVRKLMLRSEERKAERQVREANAPEISVAKIEEAFAAAKAGGLKWPKLNLDVFTFKPASATSRNAGAIYVTEGNTYLGKIAQGKFVCVRECTAEQQAKIIAAASDPEAAAVAYGKRTGSCSCCGRELTNAESIERGIGPICADKYGW